MRSDGAAAIPEGHQLHAEEREQTRTQQQGFRRFLLVNGHHGSKPILKAACAQVHAAIPDSRCLSVQWWELPEVRSLLLEMFGARQGHHATPGNAWGEYVVLWVWPAE